MKLNPDFILHGAGKNRVLVPVGAAADTFHGMVRLNETSYFLLDLLRRDTTPEELTQRLMTAYGIDRDRAQTSVDSVLDNLRKIKALEE